MYRLGDEESPEMYGSNWWMPLKWNIEIGTNHRQPEPRLAILSKVHKVQSESEFLREATKKLSFFSWPATKALPPSSLDRRIFFVVVVFLLLIFLSFKKKRVSMPVLYPPPPF